MNSQLTFVNSRTYTSTQVRVGIDHLQVAAGLAAVALKTYALMSGDDVSALWVVGLISLGHARMWRHLLTFPALGSVVLALMSFGMSMLVSGMVIRKMVAQHYRDAGWKVRNQDGGIGEYSSRFLAMNELGFHESDMTESAALQHH